MTTKKKKPTPKKSSSRAPKFVEIPVMIGSVAPSMSTRIDSVAFRTSVQVGQFKHVHIEASATVGHNDTPTEALMAVKAFVRAELQRARREEAAGTGTLPDNRPPWMR